MSPVQRLSLSHPILRPVHARIRQRVVDVVATRQDFGIDYDAPVGDPGLFGPGSATWIIHRDFPGMMAGGLAALILQGLHPRALAGVWDHSLFKNDAINRLRRTTMFVAATTYAPTTDAERIIERVARIHDRIHGTTADGEAYSAHDPDLLTWVHCTEMASFLAGYMRYTGETLSIAAQDRYFDETRAVAERLGARDVPASRAAMDAYFQAMRPELRFDARSRTAFSWLEQIELPMPMGGLPRRLFIGAGAALLPAWALTLMGRSRRQRMADRGAATSLRRLGPLFRGAMGDGVAVRAARRCGAPPSCLRFSSAERLVTAD